MSRLIDVDELIKYFGEDLEGYDNREYILQMLDVKGRIERVNAIPVEWIKEQLKKEEYRTFLVDYIEWGNCLRWLIDEWEKRK